jgi:hypothetical protein
MPPPSNKLPVSSSITFSKPIQSSGARILIYGTGGIGKTTIAASAPSQVVFFDLDESLGKLKIDCPVVSVASWLNFRAALQKDWPASVRSIVIDSISVAEEMCIKHVMQTVKVGNALPETLEDYGFGKDVRYVYEEFIKLLPDLDRHFRLGRNVILIAHECKPEEVNPGGMNYLRFEPRLRTSKRGENSIRFKVKEWCDFVARVEYDSVVGSDSKKVDFKKATGCGTRTMYLSEMPHFMAKNRGCAGPIEIIKGKESKIWDEILK